MFLERDAGTVVGILVLWYGAAGTDSVVPFAAFVGDGQLPDHQLPRGLGREVVRARRYQRRRRRPGMPRDLGACVT
eukprot:42880-Rhodomonas_salina.1